MENTTKKQKTPKKTKIVKTKTVASNASCSHNRENIGVITPNKLLTPINGKIYWHVDENFLSTDMEKYKIIYAFSQSFAKWQPYFNPIVFEATNDITKAQITIRFMVNGNKDLPAPFEPGVLAYTYAPNGTSLGINSDMYINDEYKWDDMLHQDSIVLFNVVVHELGHAFNLGHSQDIKDIMYPYYQPNNNVVISLDTQKGIYDLYKAYGVANPNHTQNNNVLNLKELFATRTDIGRLSERQLKVLGNCLSAGILQYDKLPAIITKVFSKISAL